MTLIAARYASQTLVYRHLHERRLNDFSTRPSSVPWDQVITEPFDSVVSDLPISMPISPFDPVARILGRLDNWSIVVISLLLSLIVFQQASRRWPEPQPEPTPSKD